MSKNVVSTIAALRACLFLLSVIVVQSRSSGAFSLGDKLEKKVVDIFEQMDSLPLSFSKKGIDVRTKWDGDCMLALSEAKEAPYHPKLFRCLLENFSDTFPKVNKMALNVIPLQKEGDIREGIKTELKFPFPLTNRLMIHWKYNRLDRGPDEHLLVISEEGNEELLQKFHTEQEKKRLVLGHTFLCAYWVKPVYDKNDKEKVVGSNIRYAFSGDTGGSVPKAIQNLVGPKTAWESIDGLIKHAADQK